MKKSIIKISLVCLGLLTVNAADAQIRKVRRATGSTTIGNSQPKTSWTGTHTLTPRVGNRKVWDNVKFIPGKYRVTITVTGRNRRRDDTQDVTLRVTGKFNGGNNARSDEKFEFKTVKRRVINREVYIRDVNSKSSGNALGYGKIQIFSKKSNLATNANYTINIVKVNSNVKVWDVMNTWTGLVVPKTSGRRVTSKKCISRKAKIIIHKTRITPTGKIRVEIFTSTTKTGTRTSLKVSEISYPRSKKINTISVTGVKNKFIHIVMYNKSAVAGFQWKTVVKEEYGN